MEMNLIDRSNYFRGLLLLTAKDKNISEPEKYLLIQKGRDLGFAKDFCEKALTELPDNEYIIDLPPVFSNPNVAEDFINEGLRIAFSDKSLHLFELKWLIKTADKNNVERKWVMDKVVEFLEKENKKSEVSHQQLVA
ncbi:MAG: hypothetical protein A2068_08610 [Ignavibacteria bacterium GWB2_35_6b]|nr:MAG: hypothetical protein A2068_08610 [Ignavibacteria bacterium GWB2_35_6b]